MKTESLPPPLRRKRTDVSYARRRRQTFKSKFNGADVQGERRDEIVRLYDEGVSPARIAVIVDYDLRRILTVLLAHGRDVSAYSPRDWGLTRQDERDDEERYVESMR